MKIKAILVDEVPERCENCLFGHRPLTEDDDACDLHEIVGQSTCPLMTEKEYLHPRD